MRGLDSGGLQPGPARRGEIQSVASRCYDGSRGESHADARERRSPVPRGARLIASGTLLGHYRIETLLGKGGMAEVYRATHLKLEKELALKVLPELCAREPELLRR